ncbi:hypothetical protein BLNAU_21602 [Blattamonas nauphoetae]|uniref:Uncharacterized protein n=1 Tax=Blattamonas nauphoetae TaxID=2049346 RepID=A0ABQ9WYI6_9EUKA|nr:hypothetical protein BLNAU_21602 [Blattamonas nauphoetae]
MLLSLSLLSLIFSHSTRSLLASFLDQRKLEPQLEEAIEILLLFIHHQPALPLSSIASCPITLLDEYPSLSSFLHIHSTIILFSLLHTLVPFHQSIISKAGPFTSVTERLVASIGLHTLYPLLQAMTLLRHLILFSPPHTVKQLQDRAFRCAPIARKEDTSWMSMSIAAESNAVGSSAALHIRDCYRDLVCTTQPSSLLPPPCSHTARFFTPLDTKDKQSEPLRLQPSSIAHPLLTSPSTTSSTDTRVLCLPRSICSTPSTSPTYISPFYEPARHFHVPHVARTELSAVAVHPPTVLVLGDVLAGLLLPQHVALRQLQPAHQTPMGGTRLISGTSPTRSCGRGRGSRWCTLWMLRDLIESYTTLVSFSAQEIQRHIALKLKLLVKDFQAKTKTSPRTTSENIDSWSESPSEQTKDDPQHTTQHPLPNPFRVHSDDTVKRTTVDADGSGRDLGDPLSLADWDRALSQAKEDGLDVKEGEKMSKLHHFEHTTTTFLHTLIRDRIQSELNLKDALSKQGKSTAKHSMTSSKPQITDYFTEAHSKDFENTQILTVAVKRGHSLLSPVGRMVKEATLTNSAFWAMFDSDTRSPVLVWGEKDRQELVSFLHNEMEDNAKLTATTNKPTDAAMKEDATFTLDPDLVCTYSVEESVKSVMVDGKLAFVFPSSMQDQSHANLNKDKRSAPSQTRSSIPAGHLPTCADSLHLRLVFTSSLSHVKAGEYFIDVLMEEYAPVLFLVHQHSVENVAQLLASDERRKAGGSQTITYSAERPPALRRTTGSHISNTAYRHHARNRRLFSVCEVSVCSVQSPSLRRRADEADRMPRTELENILALVRCSPRLVCAAPSAPILRRFEPTLSADESVASVSLIHTIQRTAAGRKSSEQFAEHGEFELLTLIHSSKARLLSFKDKNGIALVFSFFNVAPFLSTLYPISSTVQPDDSLLARSAPRQKTQSSVPLVSFSRIESTLSHPISFPKTHRVIVSLDSLIPLFASNQIFPLSIGPRSFLYQNQVSRYNRSATTKDNFDVLNHLFKVFLHDMSPLSLAFLPFAPTKATLTRIAKLYISASSPDAREAVKMEMSVMIKRMSQYAERKHAREEKWNELASFHSQDRHSRQSGCAVCTAIIQLGKEESADFEATRASLYLHLNTAIKLKQRPPNSFCNIQSVVGRWNVIKTSADADFDETEFRDERVSSFILSSHDNTLDLHGNQITHTKKKLQKTPQTRSSTLLPRPARWTIASQSRHTSNRHPPFPVRLYTGHHSTSSQHAENVPTTRLETSLTTCTGHLITVTPSRPVFTCILVVVHSPRHTHSILRQCPDEEDDENFDAMDEFRQFSLQKSFGGRGSEWGGASNGGRGGHLTNLFACFPLSIPPHADAQKTNDMAFPPSTRLKMHKERSTLFLLQYVCMITDLPLKDDMVTFDDTTRSGSVSPYFEALHIISRCLLTQSPVARLSIPSSRQLVFRSIR